MDRANHAYLGDLRHLDGVRYDRMGILFGALSAWSGRGGIFSRHHCLHVSLVSLRGSRKSRRVVYVGVAGVAIDRRAVIRIDYGTRSLERMGRMAMGFYPRRHPGDNPRSHHDLLPYRPAASSEVVA